MERLESKHLIQFVPKKPNPICVIYISSLKFSLFTKFSKHYFLFVIFLNFYYFQNFNIFLNIIFTHLNIILISPFLKILLSSKYSYFNLFFKKKIFISFSYIFKQFFYAFIYFYQISSFSHSSFLKTTLQSSNTFFFLCIWQ